MVIRDGDLHSFRRVCSGGVYDSLEPWSHDHDVHGIRCRDRVHDVRGIRDVRILMVPDDDSVVARSFHGGRDGVRGDVRDVRENSIPTILHGKAAAIYGKAVLCSVVSPLDGSISMVKMLCCVDVDIRDVASL